jgi:hypothetical protein
MEGFKLSKRKYGRAKEVRGKRGLLCEKVIERRRAKKVCENTYEILFL